MVATGIKRLDPAADGSGEEVASLASPSPVEAAYELSVHEDRIALGDRVQYRTADRGVPRRDWEGEQAFAYFGNGDAKSVTSGIS